MKRILQSILVVTFISCFTTAKAEIDSMAHYFIRHEYNCLQDAQPALNSFFQKLSELEKGDIHRVSIVHIGDSHLQAGFISQKMRRLFQAKFGNAGRGLVFPYRVAGTNCPTDYISKSNVEWESSRCVSRDMIVKPGLAGIAMETYSKDWVLKLALRDNDHVDFPFDQITLLHDKGDDVQDITLNKCDDLDIISKYYTEKETKYHTIKSGDYLGTIAAKYKVSVSQLRKWNKLKGDNIYAGQKLKINEGEKVASAIPGHNFEEIVYIDNQYTSSDDYSTTVNLHRPIENIFIRPATQNSSQNRTKLYGAVLEHSSQRGVLYHEIGINGATFRNYNRTELFSTQLPVLAPDLIIISLGTNDAYYDKFNGEYFEKQVNQFIEELQSANPESAILITGVSEIKNRRKQISPNVTAVNEILHRSGNNRYTAFWDFHEAMGGYGSMDLWYEGGLAQKDRLHFKQSGYEAQAQMLYGAILSSFQYYKDTEVD